MNHRGLVAPSPKEGARCGQVLRGVGAVKTADALIIPKLPNLEKFFAGSPQIRYSRRMEIGLALVGVFIGVSIGTAVRMAVRRTRKAEGEERSPSAEERREARRQRRG